MPIQMKAITGKTVLVLLAPLLMCCASRPVRDYSTLDIYIPPGINIGNDELKNRLGDIKLTEGSGCRLRITVYGYSPGAEVMSFSDEKNFSSSRGRAWIKGLVQVICGNSIISADFIEVSAEDREEVLDGFAARIKGLTGKWKP